MVHVPALRATAAAFAVVCALEVQPIRATGTVRVTWQNAHVPAKNYTSSLTTAKFPAQRTTARSATDTGSVQDLVHATVRKRKASMGGTERPVKFIVHEERPT